ncbi:MAG: hypothetical protein WCF35_02845, partial [Pseudolabrys sp.]
PVIASGAKQSHPVTRCDGDCRVAALLIPGGEIIDSAVSGDRHGRRRPAIHVCVPGMALISEV